MSNTANPPVVSWWKTPPRWWALHFGQKQGRVLLVLSILIGALTGLAVVAFIVLTERLGMRLYPVGSAAWRRMLIPVAGSLGMGYLLFRYFPDARGSGVPQTKAALYARGGVITMRTIVGKFFCTSATLASGIPLGREGPSVQVGAGIASVLGRRLGLRPENVKALIPVGAAAAIAAAFNTPLAAVVFSLEEIVGDLNAPVLGGVVLASATSWLVLRMLLGNAPLFQVPQYQLVHPVEFALYAVLGIAGGLVSVVFTKLLLGMRVWFAHLPTWTRWKMSKPDPHSQQELREHHGNKTARNSEHCIQRKFHWVDQLILRHLKKRSVAQQHAQHQPGSCRSEDDAAQHGRIEIAHNFLKGKYNGSE